MSLLVLDMCKRLLTRRRRQQGCDAGRIRQAADGQNEVEIHGPPRVAAAGQQRCRQAVFSPPIAGDAARGGRWGGYVAQVFGEDPLNDGLADAAKSLGRGGKSNCLMSYTDINNRPPS